MQNTKLNKALFNLFESIGAITQEIHDLAPNSLARKDTLFILPNGMDINEIQALSHYLHEFTGLATALKTPLDQDHAVLEASRLINFLGDLSSSNKWVFHLPQINHLVDSIRHSRHLSYASFDKLIIKEKHSTTGVSAQKKPIEGYCCFKGSADDGFDRLHLHKALIDSMSEVKKALEQSGDVPDPDTTAPDLTPELTELLIIISTIHTEIRNYAEWSHKHSNEILCYWEISRLTDCVLRICEAVKALSSTSLSTAERLSKIKDTAQRIKPHLEKTADNPFALTHTVERQYRSDAYTHLGVSQVYMTSIYYHKKWPNFIKDIFYKLGLGWTEVGNIDRVNPICEVAKDSSAPSRLYIPTNTIKTLKYIEHKLKPVA